MRITTPRSVPDTAPLFVDLTVQLVDPDRLRLTGSAALDCDRGGCTFTLGDPRGAVVFRVPTALPGGDYELGIEWLRDDDGEPRDYLAVGDHYHLAPIGPGEGLELKLVASPQPGPGAGKPARRMIGNIKVREPGGDG